MVEKYSGPAYDSQDISQFVTQSQAPGWPGISDQSLKITRTESCTKFPPVDLHQGLQGGVPHCSLGVAVGGDDAGDELADGQLAGTVGVQSVLEQHQDLLPHSTVLVTEGRLDLLEERLRGDGGVHQLAQHDVGLLPHLRPGVAQPVLHGHQDGVQVGLELGGQPVDDESNDVQTVLRHLQSSFLVLD